MRTVSRWSSVIAFMALSILTPNANSTDAVNGSTSRTATPKRPGMTPAERQAYARQMFAEQPQYFPAQHRTSILEGRVELGMAPFEARLAGGAFTYKVQADPKIWPPGADPFDVMWEQSATPDDSVIVMTFSNSSQFANEPERRFAVTFRRGVAVELKRLD